MLNISFSENMFYGQPDIFTSHSTSSPSPRPSKALTSLSRPSQTLLGLTLSSS